MQLDFQKEKEKVQALSDAELVGRLRDPAATATDRMLIEAEIAKRGLDRRVAVAAPRQEPPKLAKTGSRVFSSVFIIIVLTSIITGVLEQFGVDLVEWLRDLFGGDGTTERLPPSP